MCFACNLYGTWLFLKTRFDIPLFREPYLHCFLSVFPELLIYCSRDSKLSEVCPSFFDQMPGSCPYFTCKIGLVILKIAYVYSLWGISWLWLLSKGRGFESWGEQDDFFFHFYFFLPLHTWSFMIIKRYKSLNLAR